jgi:SAM-dependent methyltransferase
MVDSTTHYRVLLAKHYSWMLGKEFEQAVADQLREFTALGIGEGRRALAVDLGCGPGHQAAALADLGFDKVLAVDTSQTLLDELVQHRGSRPIDTICANILGLAHHMADGSADVVVCVGDTLTHLETQAAVQNLIDGCCRALRPGGRLLLSFRDYTKPLDRVIPVRLDTDRLMTCILDYVDDHVDVTDLIYSRAGAGWDVNKSSYRKLRLSPDDVVGRLCSLGFATESIPGRMTTIIAIKPVIVTANQATVHRERLPCGRAASSQ